MADYRVRCPKCGSRTSGDVNFCPSCGAGLNDDLLILEADAPGGAAASGRAAGSAHGGTSRKPWIAIGAAVVAVVLVVQLTHKGKKSPAAPPAASPTTTGTTAPVGGAAGVATTTTSTTFVTGATQTILFVASTNAVERLDLDSAASRSYQISGIGQTITTQGIGAGVALVGDRVVVQQGDNTVALPANLSGPPVVLGPSVGFLPSRPGRVWLLSVPSTGPVVLEVDLAGHATSAPSALPADWQPVAMVSSGLLLNGGPGFEVWDPGANRVVFRGPPQASVVAAAGQQVAWQYSGCYQLCAVHVTNLATGATAVLYPQPFRQLGSLQAGAFSADGRFLAITGFSNAGGSLLIIDLQTQQTESVPASPGGGGPDTPAWSPSGRWIFLVDPSSSGAVSAFQRGTPSLQTVRLPPPASGPLAVATAAAS